MGIFDRDDTAEEWLEAEVRKLERAKEVWKLYKAYLERKYPPKDGEEFQLTCEYHQELDLVLGKK